MGLALGKDTIPTHIQNVAYEALLGARSPPDAVDDNVYRTIRRMCKSQTDGPGVVLCLTNNLRGNQWRPVIKTLMVLHRLMRDLGRPFLDGYASFLDASMISHVPDMPHFVDESSDRGSLLVRTYSRFLHLRLEAFRDPSRYDPHKDSGKRHGSFGVMTVAELLKVLPRVTRLLMAGTNVPLDTATLMMPQAQQILSMCLLDIFQCTLDVMDGLNRLTVSIFDLETGGQKARIALKLVEDAQHTLERADAFYKKCKTLSPGSEFPVVTLPPPALLKRVQEWGLGAALATDSPTRTVSLGQTLPLNPPVHPAQLERISPPGSTRKVNRSLTEEFEDPLALGKADPLQHAYKPPPMPSALPSLDVRVSAGGPDQQSGAQPVFRFPGLGQLDERVSSSTAFSSCSTIRVEDLTSDDHGRDSGASSRASGAMRGPHDEPHFHGFGHDSQHLVPSSNTSTPTMFDSHEHAHGFDPSGYVQGMARSQCSSGGSDVPRVYPSAKSRERSTTPQHQRTTPASVNSGGSGKPPMAPLLRLLMQQEERSPSLSNQGPPTPNTPAGMPPPHIGPYGSPYNTLNAGGEGSHGSPSTLAPNPIYPPSNNSCTLEPSVAPHIRMPVPTVIIPPSPRDGVAFGPSPNSGPNSRSSFGLHVSNGSLPASSAPSVAQLQRLNSSGSFTAFASGGRHSLNQSHHASPRTSNLAHPSSAGPGASGVATVLSASSPYSTYGPESASRVVEGMAQMTLGPDSRTGSSNYSTLSRESSGKLKREYELADEGVRAYTITERVYSVLKGDKEETRAYPPPNVVFESMYPYKSSTPHGTVGRSNSQTQSFGPNGSPVKSPNSASTPQSATPKSATNPARTFPSAATPTSGNSAANIHKTFSNNSGSSGRSSGPINPFGGGVASTFPYGSGSSKEAFPSPAKKINQQKEEARRKEEEARRKEEERKRKEEEARREAEARRLAELERARQAALAALRALHDEARSLGLEPAAYNSESGELQGAVASCKAFVKQHGPEQGLLLFRLDEIRAAKEKGPGPFVNLIYRRFRTPKDGSPVPTEPAVANVSDAAAVRKAIKKALVDYHPDRNVRHGDAQWTRICNELTIALNQLLLN